MLDRSPNYYVPEFASPSGAGALAEFDFVAVRVDQHNVYDSPGALGGLLNDHTLLYMSAPWNNRPSARNDRRRIRLDSERGWCQ